VSLSFRAGVRDRIISLLETISAPGVTVFEYILRVMHGSKSIRESPVFSITLPRPKIRGFVEKFYHFTDGATHYFRNVDTQLRTVSNSCSKRRHIPLMSSVNEQTLDKLLSESLSQNIDKKIPSTTSLFEAAQVITNVEHLLAALPELEQQLAKLRFVPILFIASSHHRVVIFIYVNVPGLIYSNTRTGCQIRLSSMSSFHNTLNEANDRISSMIKSKLDDFFDLAEYDWTPAYSGGRPSLYLEELFHWLMTVVDSLPLEDLYKDTAFKNATDHVASCLMVSLCRALPTR